jgi:hypothetical protein
MNHIFIRHLISNLTPQNAFSEALAPLGFDFFPMLVIDLMHEFELGVWKSIFSHLIRLLEAYDPEKVHELNRRLVHFLHKLLFFA